jgi:uncharacterized protein YkwD
MRAAALMFVAAIGCSSGGPRRIGSEPSWRKGAPTTPTTPTTSDVMFAPASQAAIRYNDPAGAPPSTPLATAVIAAVRDAAAQAKLPAPAADARLFHACEELAQIVPEEGVVNYSLVEFALQRNGIIEPSPHLLVVWGDLDSPQVIVDQLKPRLAEILGDGATARLGVGAAKRNADGTGAVVFALQGSGIQTAPIPRAVQAGGAFTIDAAIAPAFHDTEVFVTHDDGTTERLELRTTQARAFVATSGCGARIGRQQLEITASDANGSTVLANFPVWCAAEPPATFTMSATPDDAPITSVADAEQRLLQLVNRDRAAAGLPALVQDDALAAVARAHSEEMRRTKIVAHISPTTGSAADRVKAAGIKTAVVLENVARAYGVGEAHAGLMNSPGHRANIMSASATHLGVGVVLGDEVSGRREIFVTQVFDRVPPKIDPAAALAQVRQRLVGAQPKLVTDPQLEAIAHDLAIELAAGHTRDQAWPGVKKRVDAMAAQYKRVGSVVTAVGDLAMVDGKALIGDYHPDAIGLGVAQGVHPELGEGAVWIVVLMGETR